MPMVKVKGECGALTSTSCCSAVGEAEFQRTLPLAFIQLGSNPVATSNHNLIGTVMALQRTEKRQFGETTYTRGYAHILATMQTIKL